jgi:hypothetical protein
MVKCDTTKQYFIIDVIEETIQVATSVKRTEYVRVLIADPETFIFLGAVSYHTKFS